MALPYRLQKALKLPGDVSGQLLLCDHPVLDAVQTLFRCQVEQVIDRDAEGLGQKRKRADIRHCHCVFPFGNRLCANSQFFCQLFLRRSAQYNNAEGKSPRLLVELAEMPALRPAFLPLDSFRRCFLWITYCFHLS